MVVRRILIVVIGFLLLLDVGLMGLAKFGPAEVREEPSLYDVVAWTEDAAKADSIRAQLEEAGVSPDVRDVTREKKVPDGWVVAMKSKLTDVLVSTEQVLKERGHSVELLPGGEELRLGGVYPTRKAAEAKAQAVNKKYYFNFEVYEHFKSVPAPFKEIRVTGVEQEDADRVVEIFEGEGLEYKIEELAAAEGGGTSAAGNGGEQSGEEGEDLESAGEGPAGEEPAGDGGEVKSEPGRGSDGEGEGNSGGE